MMGEISFEARNHYYL